MPSTFHCGCSCHSHQPVRGHIQSAHCKVWNLLPEKFPKHYNLDVFKARVNRHLLARVNRECKMAELNPPLILCMENATGEEVALHIEPGDDFRTFLYKAKSLLGFDVDINSITRNQPVLLTDDIYQFLLNAEQNQTIELTSHNYEQMLENNENNDDTVYVLDDGTQIRASQIHFDNEDDPVDLTAEKIPFVKYSNDTFDDSEIDNVECENKVYNIIDSPIRNKDSPKCSFANSLPFRPVCNNTSGFEAQFTKYLEANNKTYANLNPASNRNKSPRSLIRDNYKKYDDSYYKSDDFSHYTREEILNMLKDSPVTSLPYETQSFNEKRRHVRKTDPTRIVHKSWTKPISYIDVDGVLIAESESQNCFICEKYVDNHLDKLYLFDNEDQRLHRCSPQKKLSTQLKIICEQCLQENFRPCRMKSPNQSLSPDEYLVIRNNHQYIFQKINNLDFKSYTENKTDTNKVYITEFYKKEDKSEYLKVEIGSDGEIVTKPANEDFLLKEECKESSSDVEIIENNDIDENIIDNLDDADEEVIEFLGKYQCNDELKELKCRFCDRVFSELSEVIEHGEEHKHETEDGAVFPCPLCDYGYANFKWLKGHLKAAHNKPKVIKTEEKDEVKSGDIKQDAEEGTKSKGASPIAGRLRNSDKKPEEDGASPKGPEKIEEKQEDIKLDSKEIVEVKTELKEECESSDDEIWIVQAEHENTATNKNDSDCEKYRCNKCSQLFISRAYLAAHKCRKRSRRTKREILHLSKRDVYKDLDDSGDDLFSVRSRRRKHREPTSDPQIVTCHNCNESFTSKVRLKFHMQFHDSTALLSPEGKYMCTECDNTQFSTETELFDHVHFQHHKQKRWQCPVVGCEKTFYLRATLTKHSRTHTDTRRYVCGTCGKRFLDKQTLDEHGVTHLQIKPFQCHICLKQLTRRSRLRMHLRAHEEELRPRLVLVCAVCAQAFRDHTHAQEHPSRSPECIEEFAKELKEEEAVTVQLSPSSGLVRHTVQVIESPKLSKPIRRQVDRSLAEPLLSRVSDDARAIIRVVEIEKAFRCEFCEDVFYSEDGLNSHRVIHKGVKNPFTCHICKVSFATYSRCTTHKTTHGFYKRSLADVKRSTGNATGHGPAATGILGYGDFPVVKHFLCEDCGRSYLHWTYLQVHRRMKHASDKPLYKCNQCELSFPNSWGMSYHRKKIHGKPDDDNIGPIRPTKDDYRIPCRDCDEVLPNKGALYKHRKKEHSDLTLQINSKGVFWCSAQSCPPSDTAEDGATSSAGPNAPVTTSVLKAHAVPTKDLPNLEYTCTICGESFPTRNELSSHVRSHAANPHSTNTHGTNRHAPWRQHACSVCGHGFRTLSMLAEHARIHTGERPFPCDVCGLAFRRSTAMRNHRLIHSGIRNWACSRCPKRFRIRSDLRTHTRLKHPLSLHVIEMSGLHPTPEQVMELLSANHIAHDKVIEISKISFHKGTTSIIPNSSRALNLLSNVPRTQLACQRTRPGRSMEAMTPARRGRGIARSERKPRLLPRPIDDSDLTANIQASERSKPELSAHEQMVQQNKQQIQQIQQQIQQQLQQQLSQQQFSQQQMLQQPQMSNTFPITLNVSNEDMQELNVQLLLEGATCGERDTSSTVGSVSMP